MDCALVGAKRVELHDFLDAWLRAYSCCIYIKIHCHNNSFVTSLVTFKSKVSLIKLLSIPEMEFSFGFYFTGSFGVLAVIELPSIYYLSDFIVELPCVHENGKPSGTFVSKRLDKVQKLVNVPCWHYLESMEIYSI